MAQEAKLRIAQGVFFVGGVGRKTGKNILEGALLRVFSKAFLKAMGTLLRGSGQEGASQCKITVLPPSLSWFS